MEAVALDIGGIMTPTFVVPDTSGLAPLTLPESFLGRHDTPQPYPDAVRRFEAAMGDAAPQAAARAFCASLAVADMPQQAVSQDGLCRRYKAERSEAVRQDRRTVLAARCYTVVDYTAWYSPRISLSLSSVLLRRVVTVETGIFNSSLISLSLYCIKYARYNTSRKRGRN